MPNVNVYVSEELRDRMSRAGDRPWSALAQRAFESECNLMEILMETEDTVVSRLHASKRKREESETAAGREAGQRWARDAAEYHELELVATNEFDDKTIIEELGCCIYGSVPSPSDWDSLLPWTSAAPGREAMPSRAWAWGFIEGATEVWEAVADKIPD
jgi:hypothetical protein